METALDALGALTRRFAFGDVAALLAEGAGGDRLATREVTQLCAFGQQLIDLDAEDFGDIGGGTRVPRDLVERSLACRMPQSPKEPHRGALGSLKPAYRLLLEVVEARFRRRETTAVVATVHIASEYAPMLAWEQVLGHGSDPVRLAMSVTGEGSVWGDFDDRECPHTKSEKSAAKRVLTVAQENSVGWRTYLDRQHSNVSHALAVCAAECRRPCSVYKRLSAQEAEIVHHGCKLAMSLNDSAIVRLRHSAPVGHGFGVPSQEELLEAWGRTRDSLARIDPSVGQDDGFPLPGFAALVTALAGEPMAPDTLLADTAAQISSLLGAAAKERE